MGVTKGDAKSLDCLRCRVYGMGRRARKGVASGVVGIQMLKHVGRVETCGFLAIRA